MSGDSTLSLDMVRLFMISQGGKVANHELVRKFKKFLNDPSCKDTARLKFKDIINTIAVVQKEGSNKFLVLKPSYWDVEPQTSIERDSSDSPDNSLCSSISSISQPSLTVYDNRLVPTIKTIVPVEEEKELVETPLRDNICVRRSQIDFQEPSTPSDMADESADDSYSQVDHLSHSQSSPSLLEHYSQEDSLESRDGLQPPRPPPRKKSSNRGKENRGAHIEEKLRQLNQEKDTISPPKSVSREELALSPGMVKERRDMINKMTSESDLPLKTSGSNISIDGLSSSKTYPSNLNLMAACRRPPKNSDDDDSASVTTIDPRSKEWVLKAAKGDYHALAKLLIEEPKLAGFKDFISGFTALHWASKHGNADLVKLIAGTHHVNPNIKSHGGYTPMHIAALYGHEEIMELLCNTYGADRNIRDYAGKFPHQYLPLTSYSRGFGPPGTVYERKPSEANIPATTNTHQQFNSLPSSLHQGRNSQPHLLQSYQSDPNGQAPKAGVSRANSFLNLFHPVTPGLEGRNPNQPKQNIPSDADSLAAGFGVVSRRNSPAGFVNAGAPVRQASLEAERTAADPDQMKRGNFIRNSLQKSFLRATRPSIRKKLKYNKNDP